MKKVAHSPPFELLLLLTCLLRDEDLRSLKPWVPFIHQAQWVSGRVLCSRSGGGGGEDLENLITELTCRLTAEGATNPSRILVLLLTDWEVMEPGVIERVLNQLVRWCPEAHIEAMWPMSMQGNALDLILLAGEA